MEIPTSSDTLFLMIDMQEKFLPAIPRMGDVSRRIGIMLSGMNELKCPVVVTEQYPRGLGATLDSLSSLFMPDVQVFEKTSFSVLGDEECRRAVTSPGRRNLIVTGVESHVCVLQTALDALARNYAVFVPADCVASRHDSDFETSLSFMRTMGIHVLSSESLLFMLLGTSKHPSFKAISKIIR